MFGRRHPVEFGGAVPSDPAYFREIPASPVKFWGNCWGVNRSRVQLINTDNSLWKINGGP